MNIIDDASDVDSDINVEDQLRLIFPFCILQFVTKNIMCVTLNL